MDKLYGNTRKILKIIISKHKQNEILTIYNIHGFSKISNNEIDLILGDLKAHGYLSYLPPHYQIKLTNKGLSYFSCETQDNLELCIKSILFPIIVSVITTIIMSLSIL